MQDRTELVTHYTAADERSRLTAAPSLELLRTRVLLERVLPGAPATVLDVGGGPGVHAHWLAGRGYTVDLVDPVPKHVEQAAAPGTVRAAVGDALALTAPDASYDAVLLLGPLYHLTERADRVRALREARRVARPGAPVAVAAISRYASMLDGFHRGFFADGTFVGIVAETLRSGQHRNPGAHPDYFTSTFFHTCAELHDELAEAGLVDVGVLPVEGPLQWAPDLSSRLADPDGRAFVLRCLERLERDPAITGSTSHLMALARSPG
ncbi:class I SAM-dependent methyltransferase [Pseudonocardia sp. HH130630-07]|uniref:class I SAM-dependent methyltransferase n=1 Tax=Pseudonocardia sp. HH130630-07 TaxID=1690815 RepID=UPI000814E9D7|nr:class I SAM-dependent methyltransferase [Pseudonocardia sp. HH130630-07]ANY06498.1 hypothetical protein AFB00_09575 [Pseudonocardia sp. HH130630-07]